LRTQ
jgi:hypothetical protein